MGSGSYGGTSAGMQRETHRGKGPKNYRRSDERITEEINERLKAHADLDASDIEVQVSNGQVTLTGEAASRSEKRMAEDCVEDVSGVEDVTNQIRVRQRGSSTAGQSTEDKGMSSSSRTGSTASTGSLGDTSREKARPTASR